MGGYIFAIARIAYTTRHEYACAGAQSVDEDGILNVKTPFSFIVLFLFILLPLGYMHT